MTQIKAPGTAMAPAPVAFKAVTSSAKMATALAMHMIRKKMVVARRRNFFCKKAWYIIACFVIIDREFLQLTWFIFLAAHLAK
ncbi:hypothetical protein ACO0LD_08165 [Undibacterium sp. Ji83W]|uniref:hypothetical protein n=1 Tax=Undibacterium sp. Ji83W TaxID=3413043 RepID=UPI003BF0F16B